MKMSAQEEIDWYRNIVRYHSYLYYTLADTLIDDNMWDILYNKLKQLEKENPELVTDDSPTQLVGENISLMHGSGKTKEDIVKMLEALE